MSPNVPAIPIALALVLLTGALAEAEAAEAQQSAAEAPAADSSTTPIDQEHRGFLLRLTAGGGLVGQGKSAHVRMRGAGYHAALAVGGSVAPRFALYGEVWHAGTNLPDSRRSLRSYAAGLGTSYYLSNNALLAFVLGWGFAQTTAARSGESGDTGPGVCIKVTVGKEWWTGPEGAIGLVGFASYRYHPLFAGAEQWHGGTIGLALSLTVN